MIYKTHASKWHFLFSFAFLISGYCRAGDVKDFVKKIQLEDGRIALKKQRLEKISALAKARASEAAKATTAPTITVSTEPGPSKPTEGLTPRAETAPGTLAAPRPVAGIGNSPIHPSLPPKPGSPSKLPSSSQEPLKTSTPSPRPADAVAPAPAVLPVTAPILAPAPATLDPEIAKHEEVGDIFGTCASLFFVTDSPPRISTDGRGLRFVQLVINICSISVKLELVTLKPLPKKSRKRERKRKRV
jgi:hypothetical protein